MVSKEHTKRRILNLVEAYKTAFPEEYKVACDGIIAGRQILEHETGALTGEHNGASAQRVLHEIPEKLYQSFFDELDQEELTFFRSIEGSRWFTQAVPQFALAKV